MCSIQTVTERVPHGDDVARVGLMWRAHALRDAFAAMSSARPAIAGTANTGSVAHTITRTHGWRENVI